MFKITNFATKSVAAIFRVLSTVLIVTVLLLLTISISACRSQRNVSGNEQNIGTGFITSCYPIENFFVPASRLELSMGDQSFSLNGSIYIQPDSIFYFRGRLLLAEVRGVIYRDNFIVVSYLERIIYRGNNDFLQRLMGFRVSPESLMALFTADRCEEVFDSALGFTVDTKNNDRITMEGDNFSFLEMFINTSNGTIENITIETFSHQLYNVDYSGYNNFGLYNLPTVIDISANDGSRSIFKMTANFQQIALNQQEDINMNIPSNYRVVVLE